MTDKLLKFFKKLILIQIAVLALVAGFRYLTPNLYAAVYRAHNSEQPESFIITANTIDFVKEDGSQVTLWSGTEDIDLMTVNSLADVKSFNVDVPSGTYKQFAIHFSKNFKVKGSVTVNGTKYYTKASHTGHATGPAELETLNQGAAMNDVQSYARDFNPRLRVGSGVSLSSVHILVDAAEYLSYYDGTGTAPNGTSGAGMYIWNYLPVAITFGTPAKKEVYEYGATGYTTEKGRLTIIYDSSDTPVSASARPSYTNNSGTGFNLSGWLMGGTGAVELEYVKKVDANTVWIKMYDTVAMAYLGQTDSSDYKLFATFQRTAVGALQNGTYTNKAGTVSGYSATRIE